MVAVFHQDFGHGVCQTINLVDETGDEQSTTLIIRDGCTVRHLRGCVHAEQHHFFVIVTGNAGDLGNETLPLVIALLVYTIKDFIEDRFDYRSKVRTAHWGCHVLLPFFSLFDVSGNERVVGKLDVNDSGSVAPSVINFTTKANNLHLSLCTNSHGCRIQTGS